VLAARAATPLGRLAARFGLSRLEIETLVFAVAPHIDPPLADLFNAVRGVRRGVTLALITQLLRLGREDRVSLLGALDPERPLCAWRLIEVGPGDTDGSAANRTIQPTFGTLELIGDVTGPTSSIQRYAELVRAPATLDDLVLPPAQRAVVERLCAARGAQPWLVTWGIEGSGKRELAARIAAFANRPLLAVDVMAVERASRPELLRLAQRDAIAHDATLYLGPLPPQSDEANELLRRLVRHPGAVVLGVESSRPPRLRVEHAVRELEVGIPGERARLELWRRGIPGADAEKLEPIARGFHLTPGEILETTAEASTVASSEGRAITYGDLRAGIDRRLRNGLQDLAWRVDVTARWEDLVLTAEDRDRVEEFIARRVFASQVYGEWGFGARIERGRGAIALFSGPPGTGKTMLAGVIARGLGLELYQVDISQIQSRWVGETEKQLGRVFDLAERAHAVLLFDEADSLLAKRTDVETANDRYANSNTNYLLQRLEQYTGVAVLTTNRDTALDEALQRRLTLRLRLSVPEIPERERLWTSFLPAAVPRERHIDVETLARDYELTGGYIKNVVVRAAFLAAREQRKLGTALLRRAAVLEMEDMGRVILAR
jgi:hypothetical protein